MIDHQLSSFLVGIRFVRKFSILDKWGEILDMVLSNNEFFASDYFNQIQNANGPELVLSDPYGGYLRLNSTDLIFSKSFVQLSNNTAYTRYQHRSSKSFARSAYASF